MASETNLTGSLQQNRKLIQQSLGDLRGVIFRDLLLYKSGSEPVAALLVCMEAQVDRERLEAHLLWPLQEEIDTRMPGWRKRLTPYSKIVNSLEQASSMLFRGFVLVQIEQTTEVVAFDLSQISFPEISAPENESGVYGPKETLTESLQVSLSQLRRRLPGPDLRLESVWIGNRAPVEAVIAYVQGRPTDKMVRELRQRLEAVKQDGIQEVSELTEAVADSRMTLFPSVLISERPDMIVHFMMSGRIVILLENSPRALILPALFGDFFTTPDDFYEWRPYVVMMRLIRFLAYNISVPLPSFYVAVTTFHLQAMPTQLTLSLQALRETAPLPGPIEAILMTLIFEILKEAGIRLPKAIGSTITIVGGLVIGEAAIRSGLASPAMVLVISLTAVATFAIPSPALSNASTYYRFGILLLTSFLGFFGLLLGYLVIIANLSVMTSLGVPYMTPLFPLKFRYLAVVMGLRPRPPAKEGTHTPASLTRQAEEYQDGET